MKPRLISIDHLADVVGGQGLASQRPILSMAPTEASGPQVGASTWQPPGASYHFQYGGWKDGGATSWKTIDNKTGGVISNGINTN